MVIAEQSAAARIGEGLLLALDTSTRCMTASLALEGGTVAETHAIAERNHSIYLMPAIRDMLQGNGYRPSDVQAIAVGIGPGSYTGVRIAVTVAKTMAWTLGVPVVGVSSLQALARGGARANPGDGAGSEAVRWYVPLMDARRGQVYTALYALQPNGTWLTLVPDSIRPMGQWLEELFRRLAGEPSGPGEAGASTSISAARSKSALEVIMVGDIESYESFAEKADGRLDSRSALSLRLDRRELSAVDVARLGRERLLRGERDDAHELAPNYTQLAEAETKLLAKQQRGGEGHGGAC